jgi:hypothetical protein
VVRLINPIEKIKEDIPELQTISNNPNNLEYVRNKNFDSRITRIQNHNLRKYKKSLSAVSMGIYFNPCIVEVQTDNDVVVVNKLKYKLIANYLKGLEFNN